MGLLAVTERERKLEGLLLHERIGSRARTFWREVGCQEITDRTRTGTEQR